jgi:hypothetical protein
VAWCWRARNTAAEIIDRLNREINAGLADPKMKARLTDFGGHATDGWNAHRRRNTELGLSRNSRRGAP